MVYLSMLINGLSLNITSNQETGRRVLCVNHQRTTPHTNIEMKWVPLEEVSTFLLIGTERKYISTSMV